MGDEEVENKDKHEETSIDQVDKEGEQECVLLVGRSPPSSTTSRGTSATTSSPRAIWELEVNR